MEKKEYIEINLAVVFAVIVAIIALCVGCTWSTVAVAGVVSYVLAAVIPWAICSFLVGRAK